MDYSNTIPDPNDNVLGSPQGQNWDVGAFYHTPTPPYSSLDRYMEEGTAAISVKLAHDYASDQGGTHDSIPNHHSTSDHSAISNYGTTPDYCTFVDGTAPTISNQSTIHIHIHSTTPAHSIPVHGTVIPNNSTTTMAPSHSTMTMTPDPIHGTPGTAEASLNVDSGAAEQPFEIVETGGSTTHLCKCGTSIRRMTDLRRHWKTRLHGGKGHRCPTCRKQYSRKYQLTKHECKGGSGVEHSTTGIFSET
ncbi:hypothetical protein AX15_006696 [Amanita polypyramis BW_CC]|nr:hypothetical protein AX15_006696 [Amanita polypyramis BW_CC]